MNLPLLRSVVWKEYRVLRPVWLSMLAIAVSMQLMVLVSFAFSQQSKVDSNELTAWLFGIALTMGAMYALGCTAALFSAEREDETHEFLLLRAPSPRALIGGKAAFGLATIAGLVVLLWLAAAILSGGKLPQADVHRDLWASMGLAILELFAWGTLFSLLLKHPLRAAILAVGVSSVSVQLLPHLSDSPQTPNWFMSPYLDAFPARVMLLGLLVVIDAWLAGRWFDPPRFMNQQTTRVQTHAARTNVREVGRTHTAGWATMFGRLLWQQWRHTAVTTATIFGGVLLMVVLIAIDQRIDAALLLPVAVVVSALLGISTFLADKPNHSFRFFAAHVVSPTQLWLSRMGVGLTTVALSMVLFLLVMLAFFAFGELTISSFSYQGFLRALPYALSGPLLAYGAGQLCSLLFRGGLLAAFFGLFLAGLLVGWDFLMWVIAVPWWWSVAPLAIALLMATWLRMPGWLLERRGWRPWLPVTLVLVVPTLAILVAVPFFRVYQIPLQSPGFSVAEFTKPLTAEEKKTADMYRRAWELITPMEKIKSIEKTEGSEEASSEDPESNLWHPPELSDRGIRWVEENSEAIELALQASARGPCVFNDPGHGRLYPRNLSEDYDLDLARLLVTSARILQSEGKLEEAFDRYRATLNLANDLRHRGSLVSWSGASLMDDWVYEHIPTWAAADGQTPERVREAITEIVQIARDAPLLTDTVKAEYVRLLRLLSTDVNSLASLDLSEQRVRTLVLYHYLAPWELSRAKRLVNVFTARALQEIDFPKKPHEEGRSWSRTPYREDYQSWGKSTIFVNQSIADQNWIIDQMDSVTLQRNAALVLMALAGWHHEHGSLPDTLNDLVGTYFEHLPLDIHSGKPFGYRPQGFPTPMRFGSPNSPIPAGWPLIWSVGSAQAQIVLTETNEEGLAVYQIQSTVTGSVRTAGDRYAFGLAFPLPDLETNTE